MDLDDLRGELDLLHQSVGILDKKCTNILGSWQKCQYPSYVDLQIFMIFMILFMIVNAFQDCCCFDAMFSEFEVIVRIVHNACCMCLCVFGCVYDCVWISICSLRVLCVFLCLIVYRICQDFVSCFMICIWVFYIICLRDVINSVCCLCDCSAFSVFMVL